MRIAYISHVDSRWIKQRPQFLAEALVDKRTRVSFVCSSIVRRRSLVRDQGLAVPVVRVPLLPQSLRSKLRCFESTAAFVSALMIVLRVRPRAVIVTHVRHLSLARVLRAWGIDVYYDCMDLNSLFVDSIGRDSSDEFDLVSLCEKVFCSSLRIEEHIRLLDSDAKVISVTNGLDPLSFVHPESSGLVQPLSVGYVGTVSSWFDFEVVLALLEAKPEISVTICGPVDIDIPTHARIHFLGILPHSEAVAAMNQCSVLVLPFRLTDLVQAVDPVKVYEYVATGRPVVAVKYDQLEHFGDLIHRYSSKTEFVTQVSELVSAPRLVEDVRLRFIEENSWSKRAETVRREITEC